MAAHLHYIVQAYENKTDTGIVSDNTTLDLIANTEAEAIKRAKSLVKKSYYRVSQIVEHDPVIEK